MRQMITQITKWWKKEKLMAAASKISVALVVSLASFNTSAQVANYGFTQSVGTYTPLTAPTYSMGNVFVNSTYYFTDPALLGGSATIVSGPGFPIGFPFFYDGNMFDRIGINFGGWISLGNSFVSPSVVMAAASGAQAQPLSYTGAILPAQFRARIAGVANVNGTTNPFPINLKTLGVAPNRICVVEFNNMSQSLNNQINDITFQIRLYETSNKVEVVFGPVFFTNGNYSHQSGLGGFVPTDYNNRTTSTNWNSTTAGTANSATMTAGPTIVPPVYGLTFAWVPSAPCNGFVFAGQTIGPDSVCFGVPFNLTLQNNNFYSGVDYQWQRDTPSTAPGFFDIPGATNSFYTIPTQSVTTAYRIRMICLASNDTSYSTPHTVYQKNYLGCYCNSSFASSTQFEEIFKVTLGSLNNNSNCGTSNNQYSDFRGIIPPPNLSQGTLYNLGLTLSSCTPSLASREAKVWIDYNQNGLFGDDPNELIFSNNYGANDPDPIITSTSVVIPTTVPTGLTAMRVVYARGGVSSACNPYTNGETEDYYVNIVDLPKPILSASDTSICEFSAVTISANSPAGVTINWIRPSGQGYSGSSLVIGAAQQSDSGLYKVWNTIGGVRSDTSYIRVHVTPKPTPPYVPPGGVDVCQYQVNPDFGITGQNLLWYTTQTGGFGSPTQPIIATQVPALFSYYVTQTINGCESDRILVLVKVNAKPAPPKVISPLIYCQYDALRQMPVQGQNIKWYNTPSGGIGTIVTPTINTGYIDTFTYYVSQTVGGCESDRIKFEVMIISKPNGTILTTKDWTCQYDTLGFTYFGSAPSFADYIWAAPGGKIEQNDSTVGPVIVRYNNPGTYTVSLITAIGGCASDIATKTITVRPAPTAQISAKDEICEDEQGTVVLIDVTSGSETFNWDFDGADVAFGSEGGPYGVTWTNPGDKTITLIVRNDECPSLPITKEVKVIPLPNAEITFAPGSSCAGLTSSFSAAYNPNYGYLWTPREAFVTNTNDRVYGTLQKTGWIYLEVKSPEGCRNTDSAYIEITNCCDVFLPDAFSPNGDGRNDVFRIKSEGIQTVSVFRVVNRYGQTMFETSDQMQGWDGNFSGQAQDIGTYHYFVRYKCGDGQYYEKKGDITLIR